MNLVQEKEPVVNAWNIIGEWENFPPAIFQMMWNAHTIGRFVDLWSYRNDPVKIGSDITDLVTKKFGLVYCFIS